MEIVNTDKADPHKLSSCKIYEYYKNLLNSNGSPTVKPLLQALVILMTVTVRPTGMI